MAYPGGYSSDEDGLDGFLSDDSNDSEHIEVALIEQQLNAPQEQSREQKLNSLFFAIMNGNIESVSTTLDQGIEVNAEIRDGWTPILLAASVGDSDIVQHLISKGADVNANRDKYTALMAACSCPVSTSPTSKCLEVVNQLLEKGANVDAITRTRKTAIMFAASNGNSEVVRKLLTCCDIKAEDNQGWNALFWAVNDNKPEVVQILLDAGFSLDKVDIRGNTPTFYAISQEHEDVIKILPSQVENGMIMISESSYEIATLSNNEQLQFYRDICYMLYGMKCEQLANIFANTSLLDFLSLNDAKLLELGVTIPYQRNRILTGLYKFHKHLYKQKSIPVVAKDSIYSTINVAESIVSAIRQLISMQASIKYVSHLYTNTENKPFPINIVKKRIINLKKTVIKLKSSTRTWDGNTHPVDLITSHSYVQTTPMCIKWLAHLSIVLVVSVIVNKIQNQ